MFDLSTTCHDFSCKSWVEPRPIRMSESFCHDFFFAFTKGISPNKLVNTVSCCYNKVVNKTLTLIVLMKPHAPALYFQLIVPMESPSEHT